MIKKTFGLLLLLLVPALLLCGCAERVEFEDKRVSVESSEIALVLQPGETALLDQIPGLVRADLSGSSCYEEIFAWAQANPQVEVIYTVSFPDGTVVDNSVTALDLSALSGEDTEEAAALMAFLPRLESLTLLPGSFTPAQVDTLYNAVEGLATEYSFTLGSMQVDFFTQEVDLSTISADVVPAALELLPALPELRYVELGSDSSSALTWDDIYALVQACPETDFGYDFTIYGQSFSLSDTEMDLNHITLGDNGALAFQAARCMKNLEYLDMDFCGVPNEVMEQIRDALPGVKVVWRIWFGNAYSVRTDVEKILASKPSVGGLLSDKDVEVLKYCTDVKYIDLGHNEIITDISFAAYMPKLEVAVLAMNDISDISPLANCPELEYLEIQTNNELADLSPLANCTKLAHLNTAHCRLISDISCLYGLTELERFWLGASNGVPPEQVEEFRRRVPGCEVDVNVFSDPTGAGWRVTDMNIDAWIPTYATRYELLMEQFGYAEGDYSFSWKDPKYNPS